MKYFQCSSCKTVKTINDSIIETRTVTQTDGTEIQREKVDPDRISEIICCSRRMRQFKDSGQLTAQEKYDQEMKIDRGYGVGNGNIAP